MGGNGPEFFQTIMGHKFFESTVPKLVRSLERIAVSLEKRKGPKPRDLKNLLNRAAAELEAAPGGLTDSDQSKEERTQLIEDLLTAAKEVDPDPEEPKQEGPVTPYD